MVLLVQIDTAPNNKQASTTWKFTKTSAAHPAQGLHGQRSERCYQRRHKALRGIKYKRRPKGKATVRPTQWYEEEASRVEGRLRGEWGCLQAKGVGAGANDEEERGDDMRASKGE
jgi:hypothetical protein